MTYTPREPGKWQPPLSYAEAVLIMAAVLAIELYVKARTLELAQAIRRAQVEQPKETEKGEGP